MRRFACWLAVLASAAATAETTKPDPLFQSDDMLSITIRAPFERIMDVRSLEDEEPATLVYAEADGSPREIGIQIRARGKFRRDPAACRFAPLRLNFKKSEVKGTLFHKQDKLKLVTHCESRSRRHHESLLREYLAYRVLNLLTDASFRVRLLQVTYEETEKKRKPLKEYAFLIEHKDRLGKRIDAKPFDTARIETRQIHGDYLNLTSLFQFLIANTDFSPVASPDEGSCCHNYALFGEGHDKFYSIPYDFDMSGFVNAVYAKPNPRFGIRTVHARVYRGRCLNNGHIPNTIATFNERRDDITTLIEGFTILHKKPRRNLLSKVNDFYKLINNPKTLEKKIIEECLGPHT